ncbi:MAG: hypothetical protein OXP71_01815, partial [Candidatus Poribacteria bacterium]|nr:hypothetical protein [Candidatus Poribacteria bacterium]
NSLNHSPSFNHTNHSSDSLLSFPTHYLQPLPTTRTVNLRIAAHSTHTPSIPQPNIRKLDILGGIVV